MSQPLRFAFVVSTAGSVMNSVLASEFVRSRVNLIVVEGDGTACEHARRHGLEPVIVEEHDVDAFCDRLLLLLRERQIDFVFSYYTKFYSAQLRAACADRLINFHPSLLPSFKGSDAFSRAVAYGARIVGNTVELIDEVMDEGKIIMQSACAVDVCAPEAATRHEVFVQQCQALIQVAHWLEDGRVRVDGRHVTIDGAEFRDATFSPSLDSAEALDFSRVLAEVRS